MKTTPLRLITFCFAIFCLASGLSPLSLAWGKTVIIDTPVASGGVRGNDDASNQPTLDPNNNEVIINARVPGNVTGGLELTLGSANGNTVTINSGGSVGSAVWGGQSNSASGDTTATGNSVTINGGTVGDNVYGGYATNTATDKVAATGNSVTINGGTVGGNVYGGYATTTGGSAAAAGNSVTISGDVQFAATSEIHGGYATINNVAATSTDNTLNLHTSIKINKVDGFQDMNFYLPTNMAAGDSMITINGGGSIDISGSVINVNILGESSPLGANDEIGLITADAGRVITDSSTQIRGMQGVTLKYEFDIVDGAGKAATVVTKVAANERAKALAEAFWGGLVLVNQGADLVAGLGIDRAVLAAENGFGAFGAISYGQSSYETGSSLDMRGFSLVTGFSRGTSLTPGRLTLGAFFEYGNGDYDTDNSFAGAANVRGEGKADRLGGGILSRMDFSQGQSGHAWLEGTARAGRMENDYNSHNLRDFWGRKTGFDSSSTYYGLHFGAGYVWDISEKTALDLYAKYFWSRTAGDDVTLDTGDSVEFDDVDSHRLRLGGRLAWGQSGNIRPYIGLAWEHEFDGEAQSTTVGHSIDTPSPKGSTGIGELGFSLRPSQDSTLSFDLGASGYVGQRQGVMGTLTIKYEF